MLTISTFRGKEWWSEETAVLTEFSGFRKTKLKIKNSEFDVSGESRLRGNLLGLESQVVLEMRKIKKVIRRVMEMELKHKGKKLLNILNLRRKRIQLKRELVLALRWMSHRLERRCKWLHLALLYIMANPQM